MVLTATRGELAERPADTDGGAILVAVAAGKPGALTLEQVHEVMSELSRRRPVFHSEADFQHAFAQLLGKMHQKLAVRLEIPYRSIGSTELNSRTVVDLFCHGPERATVTAIEFKYKTSWWSGAVKGEDVRLLNQSASDLGRKNFVKDIARLESWSDAEGGTAFAILLTNDEGYWSAPKVQRTTNDAAFRIHEGAKVAGELLWANNVHSRNNRTLRGSYPMRWVDYADLSEHGDGQRRRDRLRYVVAAIDG